MAKEVNKKIPIKSDKTPEESSALFHNIMKASVKGNPKPKEKQTPKKK
jgi:hypothetical protein